MNYHEPTKSTTTIPSNIREILEKIELYGAKLIKQYESKFMCKCRFGHIFTVTNLQDWCSYCKKPEFMEKLVEEINGELCELNNNLQIYHIDEYGIGKVICPIGHIAECDIDDIPNSCKSCPTPSSDSAVWHTFANNLRITQVDISDGTSQSNQSNDLKYDTDDDDADEYEQVEVDCETDSDDMCPNPWEQVDYMELSDDVFGSEPDEPDEPELDIRTMLQIHMKNMRSQKNKEVPDEFKEFGDISKLPPIEKSTAPKIFRENNIAFDKAKIPIPVVRKIPTPTTSTQLQQLTYFEIGEVNTNPFSLLDPELEEALEA